MRPISAKQFWLPDLNRNCWNRIHRSDGLIGSDVLLRSYCGGLDKLGERTVRGRECGYPITLSERKERPFSFDRSDRPFRRTRGASIFRIGSKRLGHVARGHLALVGDAVVSDALHLHGLKIRRYPSHFRKDLTSIEILRHLKKSEVRSEKPAPCPSSNFAEQTASTTALWFSVTLLRPFKFSPD